MLYDNNNEYFNTNYLCRLRKVGTKEWSVYKTHLVGYNENAGNAGTHL